MHESLAGACREIPEAALHSPTACQDFDQAMEHAHLCEAGTRKSLGPWASVDE